MAKSVVCVRQDKYNPGDFGQVYKFGGGQAIGKLQIDGLRLYLYLVIHLKNGAHWKLSPTAIKEFSGLSDSTAKNVTKRGFEQLVEAGFIVLDEKSEDSGTFFADGVVEGSS